MRNKKYEVFLGHWENGNYRIFREVANDINIYFGPIKNEMLMLGIL